MTKGQVRPVDTVLVMGSGRGIDLRIAVHEAAAALVIATSSSDEKLETLKQLGATFARSK